MGVDVGMLNTVKIYWADVSSVNSSSEQKMKDKGPTLKISAQ